jgi:hypothetical protein
MAQSNVYSLNIVGYATVTIPAGYTILANPLSNGNNAADTIMTPIDGEQILTWNAASSSFNSVSFLQAFGGWVNDDLTSATAPILPPGVGFFFKNPNAATNITFVGQVVPGPGSTNKTQLAAGYSMVGSALPANVSNITNAPVSLPVIDGMQILTFDSASSTYKSANYLQAFGGWVDDNFASIPAPGYSIGEGFFFKNPNATTTWDQSLP